MRLGWYAGVSTALAGLVVLSAFHQRANFYSAMVYLAQSNFCLLVLVNFTLLIYSSAVYGITRLCFGPLRAVEVEQLTERAWFAITETCLAMTIFREEIGAWLLVMFTALVTGKVWGWIGDGRVEILEQQPPANPRLFHLRLSLSLALSFVYDMWILRYTVNTVIQQARPNMMVMFLFEFAVLATCSWRTGVRYLLSLIEQRIIKSQTQKRLADRRQEVSEQRDTMIRQREQAAVAGEETENPAPLPDPEDIDEMDIEVPGWSSKGEWVLWLDLFTDMVKLGIYVSFFFMLLAFYGLPIHIMRDMFMTSRDFIKRLSALMRYRRAIQEMNRYPDATVEELAREDTCIICREEMRPWDPTNEAHTIDRVRPKKLPCGHILHLGCLKSWLERQQMCPTCRRPVTGDRAHPTQNRAAGLRIEIGGGRRQEGQGQQPLANNGEAPPPGQQDGAQVPQPQREGGPRIFNFGPIRLGFGANGQQVRELAQQFGLPQGPLNQGVLPQGQQAPAAPAAPPATVPPAQQQPSVTHMTGDNLQNIHTLMHQVDQLVQRELQSLHATQLELQTINLLTAEFQRLRQRQQQSQQDQSQFNQGPTAALANVLVNPPHAPNLYPLQPQVAVPQLPTFATFPAAPPRTSSPLISRYGAQGNAPAIPSGSTELPEGVVIPPGWSLLPLQRLDSAQNTTLPLTQVGLQTGDGESSNTSQPAPTPTQPISTGNSSEVQPLEPAAPTALRDEPREEDFETQPTVERPQFESTVETTPVVAPSPRAPNWGGSAQLFGNNGRLDHSETSQKAEPQIEASSDANGAGESTTTPASPVEESPVLQQPDDASEASAPPEEIPANGKGKGKAVTIEEAEDGVSD